MSAAGVLGVLLLTLFIPIHYRLWDKFPVGYHLSFLASPLPLTLLGALLKAPPNPVMPPGKIGPGSEAAG